MLLAIAAAFVVTFLIIFGSFWGFVLRPERTHSAAIRERLTTRRVSQLGPIVKAETRLSNVTALERFLANSETLVNPLRRLIDRSGMNVTVGLAVLGSAFGALIGGAFAGVITGSVAGVVLVGSACGALPLLVLRRAATKRLALFEDQFPEAIDLIARSLRAGHALTSALSLVGEEIPDPVGTEFRLLFERQNFGLSLTDALKEFAGRIPLLDARFFVTAVLIQRESGGNLSQVLDNLASVIRERFKVKRQVRVMSAHGRITGWVLGGLPMILAAVLFVIAPDHIGLLVTDPLGRQMLTGAALLQVIGVLAIRKIVDVEF
jgi:tight adherence protein B